ncbi:hypothetical protein FQR65_LT08855 [Abscondita terminalis]|nr:hypothetical protein FQR65_LT08855 [Abscondita terminalis]
MQGGKCFISSEGSSYPTDRRSLIEPSDEMKFLPKYYMDTTSNGHNAETWTQRRNDCWTYRRKFLLDATPKMETTPKSVIGHIIVSGHNVEKQKLTLHGSEIGRRIRSCNCLKRQQLFAKTKNGGQTRNLTQRNTGQRRNLDTTPKLGHNAETWTQRRNLDTTPKLGHNAETWTQRRNLDTTPKLGHNAETWTQRRNLDTTPKLGHNAETWTQRRNLDTTPKLGHNAETWTQRRNLDTTPKLGHNAETWTQRRNLDTTPKLGHNAETWTQRRNLDTTPKLGHNAETWTQRRNLDTTPKLGHNATMEQRKSWPERDTTRKEKLTTYKRRQ